MQNIQAEELLKKLALGIISAEELVMLESWYIYEIRSDKSFAGLEANLALLDERFPFVSTTTKSRKFSLWKSISIAASILLVAAFSLYYFRPFAKDEAGIVYANDVSPGKQAATLTLSSGKKVYLSEVSNGELAQESGVRISKNKAGELIYTLIATGKAPVLQSLKTFRGETQAVILPDGTKVWLNATSELSYPSSFDSSRERIVSLIGEAYFEVAKDSSHPFIVKSAQQNVSVLGTHFNIEAYRDSPTMKTTLLEGSVRVESAGQSRVLSPGEQSILTAERLAINTEVDIEEVVAWKNGYFLFNEPLYSIMDKVSRWYNVEVVYENADLKTLGFTAKLSRKRNLSALLKIIQSTGNVQFKIEGRRVYVMK